MQNETSTKKAKLPAFLADYLGLTLALAALIIYFGFSTRNFFSLMNFRTIANQVSDITIVAVGMTFVLIIAGIDLSVGSVMALAGATLGIALARLTGLVSPAIALPIAILACLLTGILCGLLNGLITIAWKLPSFIVTLGMLEVARGAAHLVTDGETMYLGRSIGVIAGSGLLIPFIAALVIVILAQIVLSRTVFGRYMIAIGTNEEAVRLSGIDPRPIKLAVFTICGLLTAIAAVISTARMESVSPNDGDGLELKAIAAVVIGGTSLMGGRGSVISSFFGVLIIAVLEAGLSQMGAKDPTKRVITGCVIIAAVILDYYRHRISARSK